MAIHTSDIKPPIHPMLRVLTGTVFAKGRMDAALLSFESMSPFNCRTDLWFLVGRDDPMSMTWLSNGLDGGTAVEEFSQLLERNPSSLPEPVELDGTYNCTMKLSERMLCDESLSILNLVERLRAHVFTDRSSEQSLSRFTGNADAWRTWLLSAANDFAGAVDKYVYAVAAPGVACSVTNYSADPGDLLEYQPAQPGSPVHEYRSGSADRRIVVPQQLSAADVPRIEITPASPWRVFRKDGMVLLGHFEEESGKCDRLFNLSMLNGRFRSELEFPGSAADRPVKKTAVFPEAVAALFHLTAGLDYKILKRESAENGRKYLQVLNDRGEEIWIDEQRLEK